MSRPFGLVPQRIAAIVSCMEALSAGLVAIANGLWETAHGVVSPMTAAIAVIGLGMSWLAAVEIEELNRQGTKPRVARH